MFATIIANAAIINGAISIPLNELETLDVKADWPSDSEIPTTVRIPKRMVARETSTQNSQAQYRDCEQNFLQPICWYAFIIVVGYVGLVVCLFYLCAAVWRKRKEVDLLSKFDGSIAM